MKVKLLSRVRLSDPMDCSLTGSSVHGIFQARVLEWDHEESLKRDLDPKLGITQEVWEATSVKSRGQGSGVSG